MAEQLFYDWPSSRQIPPMPMLWNDGLTHAIEQNHALKLDAPPAGIWAFDDAQLIGPCIPPVLQSLSEDMKNALFPGYIIRKYADESYTGQFLQGGGEHRTIDTAWTVWNYNCVIYGHFLLEVMPRLLVMRAAHRLDPSLAAIPIILPANAPSYALKWIDLLLPDFHVETKELQDVLTVRRLLIPGWGNRFVYSDVVHDELERLTAPYRQDGAARKRIFVDRRVQSYRILANAQQLQDIAASYGFESVSPEHLTLEQQIALFASADDVIGEFSSALHNSIFSPAGCRVMAMNYITECQSRIGNFRRQRVGYILPREGPIGFDPSIKGERHFEIDAATFERKLNIMLKRQ